MVVELKFQITGLKELAKNVDKLSKSFAKEHPQNCAEQCGEAGEDEGDEQHPGAWPGRER